MADKYRNPVMLLLDGTIAQMMEGVEIRDITFPPIDKSNWAITGKKGRKEHRIITSIYLDTDTCEKHNHKLFKKYDEIEKNEAEV